MAAAPARDAAFVLIFGVTGERRLVRAAHDRRLRTARAVREGRREAVSAANIVGLILAVALTGFLVVALVLPEKF